MGRIKAAGLGAFYLMCRGVAAVLPADVAYFALLPYGLARGFARAVADHTLPVSRVPAEATDPRPGFLSRWRFQAAIHQRWLMLFWADRWKEPRWSSRFSSDNAEIIDRISAERPIVILTVHTGAVIVLGSWLMNRGLGIGSVIVDQRVWARMGRVREAPRTSSRWGAYANSKTFLRGDTRSMLRYLEPGRCMVLPADHFRGRVVQGSWPGGTLRLSSGGLRMARLTGAAVIPVIVTDAGRWRFRIHVGEPIPEDLLRSDDDAAAADYIAAALMPIAASRPNEAAVTLVEASSPGYPTLPGN